jgi:hypothetical protein
MSESKKAEQAKRAAAAAVDDNLSAGASPMIGSTNDCHFCIIFQNLEKPKEASKAVADRIQKPGKDCHSYFATADCEGREFVSARKKYSSKIILGPRRLLRGCPCCCRCKACEKRFDNYVRRQPPGPVIERESKKSRSARTRSESFDAFDEASSTNFVVDDDVYENSNFGILCGEGQFHPHLASYIAAGLAESGSASKSFFLEQQCAEFSRILVERVFIVGADSPDKEEVQQSWPDRNRICQTAQGKVCSVLLLKLKLNGSGNSLVNFNLALCDCCTLLGANANDVNHCDQLREEMEVAAAKMLLKSGSMTADDLLAISKEVDFSGVTRRTTPQSGDSSASRLGLGLG